MDITEALFQYSIETNEYGTLYFMVYPDDEKDVAIQKIKEKSNGDDKLFFNFTFDELYLRGTKNTIELAEIDKSKLTSAELKEFAEHFFAIEFCNYEYHPELSWEENLKKGNKFQEERMKEVSKTLSEKLSIDYKNITDLKTKHAMIDLSDSLNNYYNKNTFIPEPLQLNPAIVESEKRKIIDKNILSHIQTIDNNLSEYGSTDLQYSKELVENIRNLTDIVINLNKVTNEVKKTHEKELQTSIDSANEQSAHAKKESKKSSWLSGIAIGVSVIALAIDIFFNISSSKKSAEYATKYEDKKIELLETLKDQNTANKEEQKKLQENYLELNTSFSDIYINLNKIIKKQNEIDKKIDTLSKKYSAKEK